MMLTSKKHSLKVLILCYFILFSFLFSGCWNYRDLEELSILSGIGIDLTKSGKIELTAQIVNTGAIKSGESGSALASPDQMVRVTSITGDTVFQTLRSFIPQASRRLYLAHMQVLVVGQEAAYKGIYPLIDFFIRDHESRPEIRLLISHEKAGDIMRSYDGLESIPAVGISRAVRASARNGFIPDVNLQEFANRLMSSTTAPIAPHIGIYEERGFNNKMTKRLRTVGTVVFRKDKVIGELDPTETRGLCWILGKVQSGIVTFQDEGIEDSFEVTKNITKIKGYLEKEMPTISVKVYVEGNFGEEQGFAPITKSEEISTLEKKISQQIKKEINAAVEKARDLNSDVFGFGEVIHREYPKEWKEMESKWPEIFPEIKIHVSVTTRISEIGMTSKPLFSPD